MGRGQPGTVKPARCTKVTPTGHRARKMTRYRRGREKYGKSLINIEQRCSAGRRGSEQREKKGGKGRHSESTERFRTITRSKN